MTSKVYLVAFAGHAASDNLHPSVAGGGSWMLVGEFKDEIAQKVADGIKLSQKGDLPGVNHGITVVAVVVKTDY